MTEQFDRLPLPVAELAADEVRVVDDGVEAGGVRVVDVLVAGRPEERGAEAHVVHVIGQLHRRHLGLETGSVDSEPAFASHLLLFIQGQAEGVVQLEGSSAGQDAARGGFRGVERRAPDLEPAERAELDRVFAGTGAALARAGYAGPFGIDGFVYGPPRTLHPLCEINARYTFGHVAHALGCRMLGFGAPVPADARVLVAPDAAWTA